MKPGQLYANYEWCTTAKYDPENEEQWKIIRAIEEGDSLPKLVSIADADAAAREAGFEIVETEDLAEGGPGQVGLMLRFLHGWFSDVRLDSPRNPGGRFSLAATRTKKRWKVL